MADGDKEGEIICEDRQLESTETDDQFALNNVADKFSKLFAVDTSKQLNHLELLVDNLLARAEECCTITDQIRGESKNLLFTTIPEFYQQCVEMQTVFRKIDLLEDFVTEIKQNVDKMDEDVQLAEKQLGSKNIKKILKTIPIPQFLAQKRQVQDYLKPEIKEDEFSKPSVFKVDDYILPSESRVSESDDA